MPYSLTKWLYKRKAVKKLFEKKKPKPKPPQKPVYYIDKDGNKIEIKGN